MSRRSSSRYVALLAASCGMLLGCADQTKNEGAGSSAARHDQPADWVIDVPFTPTRFQTVERVRRDADGVWILRREVPRNFEVIVDVETGLFDDEPLRMILDTGADSSVIYVKPGYFERNRLEPRGDSRGAGGHVIHSVEVQADYFQISGGGRGLLERPTERRSIDISIVEHPDFDDLEYDGLLGVDRLWDMIIEIDYAERRLRMREAE